MGRGNRQREKYQKRESQGKGQCRREQEVKEVSCIWDWTEIYKKQEKLKRNLSEQGREEDWYWGKGRIARMGEG